MRPVLRLHPESVAMVAMCVLLATVARSPALWAQRATPRPRIVLRVPTLPTVARGENGAFLVYELHVTNFSAQQWTLRKVEVVTTADRRVLHTLAEDALASSMTRPGTTIESDNRRILTGGAWGVIYLWVPVDRAARPTSIAHRVTLEFGAGDATQVRDLLGPEVAVNQEITTIGPPLRGGPWRAGNGPSNESAHRRALTVSDGSASSNERFAIDYVKFGDDNRTFTGDRLLNESYYAYGAEALAVADGVVVALKDGIPQNIPGPPPPPTLETVIGNHIFLEIGRERYALYAHLQPGSLRVAIGARVRRGQVIGLVGNSGNSTEPHLHFQLSDAPVLSSDGLPYEHDSFQVIGRCRGPRDCERLAPSVHRGEIPLGSMIVQFPR